jgi:hypothetical protein
LLPLLTVRVTGDVALNCKFVNVSPTVLAVTVGPKLPETDAVYEIEMEVEG